MINYGCTGCGTCSNACSISAVLGEKLSPENILKSCKRIEEGTCKPIDIMNVYRCTKCRACEEACPEEIKITGIIDSTRGKYVSEKGVRFGAQREIIKNILKYGSPFGISGSRVVFPEKQSTTRANETLLFIGCYSSYVNKDIAAAGFNILKKLGIDFTYFGKEEPCCGYYIYNTGEHKSSNYLVEKNKGLFKEKGIKKIISVCPGCTSFLTQYYKMDIEVVHISKIVSNVMKEGNIPIKKHKGFVSFHDACNIGRSLGLYTEPREMINALGYNLVEMELTREKAICCGADGGMKIIFPGLSLEIGKKRLEGMPKDCNKLFTICPYCLANLRESSEKNKYGIDIMNLLVVFNDSLL
jgi:Fe-S oxidoreductase